MNPSPRVEYWREKRRREKPLFAAACASPEEARALLPLAPDLLLYHPAFPVRTAQGETGLLSALESAGNANLDAARGVPDLLPLCAPCPVAMGVCWADPFLLRGTSFAAWRPLGLEGVANFPTIGLVDGFFRADLDASGLGLAQEIEGLRHAHAEGFFTVALACRPEDAAAFAEAGCDIVVIHLGLTADALPRPLASARKEVLSAFFAARKARSANPLLLLHADHLAGGNDEAAWKALGPEEGLDGLFAAGGPARVKALRALVPI
jgi:predicted TIM-barrel enzyme